MARVCVLLLAGDLEEVSGCGNINGFWDETLKFPYFYKTVLGRGYKGYIRSFYYWDVPKTINRMRYTVNLNLPRRT